MPKSRGRRPRRNQLGPRNRRRTHARGRTRFSPEDKARAIANMPILRALDAAEAEGDVRRATELLQSDLEKRRDTDNFWHRDRVIRLYQIRLLGSMLPGWGTSRWILAQAVRWMDASQRRRYTQAFERTVQIAGGPERYGGVDEVDSHCKLMDHDWVYRQLVLYELGGLQHFVDRVASPVLIDRADGVRDWARAPMGAFRLMGVTSTVISWLDLATGGEVTTANIGSAALLDVGEHAIGRLVPTAQGPMFESAPIFVPPDVATMIAGAPDDWMSALEHGCHREVPLGQRISTMTPGFPLVSDVPFAQRHALIDEIVAPSDAEALTWTSDDLRKAQAAVVRAAMEEEHEFEDSDFHPWPVVGSMLLDPGVLVELVRNPQVGDAAGFTTMAPRLAPPAADLCHALSLERDPAV